MSEREPRAPPTVLRFAHARSTRCYSFDPPLRSQELWGGVRFLSRWWLGALFLSWLWSVPRTVSDRRFRIERFHVALSDSFYEPHAGTATAMRSGFSLNVRAARSRCACGAPRPANALFGMDSPPQAKKILGVSGGFKQLLTGLARLGSDFLAPRGLKTGLFS